jgi:hypothetical protein
MAPHRFALASRINPSHQASSHPNAVDISTRYADHAELLREVNRRECLSTLETVEFGP